MKAVTSDNHVQRFYDSLQLFNDGQTISNAEDNDRQHNGETLTSIEGQMLEKNLDHWAAKLELESITLKSTITTTLHEVKQTLDLIKVEAMELASARGKQNHFGKQQDVKLDNKLDKLMRILPNSQQSKSIDDKLDTLHTKINNLETSCNENYKQLPKLLTIMEKPLVTLFNDLHEISNSYKSSVQLMEIAATSLSNTSASLVEIIKHLPPPPTGYCKPSLPLPKTMATTMPTQNRVLIHAAPNPDLQNPIEPPLTKKRKRN